MVESFLQVSDQFPDLRLLLLGPTKEEDSLDDMTLRVLGTHPRIILAGETLDTAPFYALMDILVLPSHREGFGIVILEAHAAGKPKIRPPS